MRNTGVDWIDPAQLPPKLNTFDSKKSSKCSNGLCPVCTTMLNPLRSTLIHIYKSTRDRRCPRFLFSLWHYQMVSEAHASKVISTFGKNWLLFRISLFAWLKCLQMYANPQETKMSWISIQFVAIPMVPKAHASWVISTFGKNWMFFRMSLLLTVSAWLGLSALEMLDTCRVDWPSVSFKDFS